MSSSQKKYQNSEKGRATKRAYFLRNKKKIYGAKQEWRKNNPSREKGYYARLKRLHPEKIEKKNFQSRVLLSGIDLTFEQYQILKKLYAGKCGICRKPNRSNRDLAIDHCHKTRRVRGMLCGKCNIGLGLLGDDIASLNRALRYLKKKR